MTKNTLSEYIFYGDLHTIVLVGNFVLCTWARHSTLTVPLSTQVYKWVPVNLMLGVKPWDGTGRPHPIHGGVGKLLLVASCYSSYVDLTLLYNLWSINLLLWYEIKLCGDVSQSTVLMIVKPATHCHMYF